MSGPAGARSRRLPLPRAAPSMLAVGGAGGLLSGLLGVGGGVVMVPLLVLWLGYDQRTAHATSLGAIIPIGLAGLVTYGAAGEVRFLDAAALVAGSLVGARVGAGILARIGQRPLKAIFGLFLVGVSVAMVLR